METLKEFQTILGLAFVQRALLIGIFTALSCALLGYFLVLRKFSLIGDGLSHVSFATVSLALLLGLSPIYLSLPLVMLASFAIFYLGEKAKIYSDSAIGLVSTSGVAFGVFIASISGGLNIDLFGYLFGNILLVETYDVVLSFLMASAILILIIIFYHDLFSITFDPEFAEVSGLNTKLINMILIMATGATIVLSIKIVGTMLVSSLIIFPTITALQFAQSFKKGLIISSIVSILSVILGIFLSILFDLPSGSTIVLLNLLFFIISFIATRIK